MGTTAGSGRDTQARERLQMRAGTASPPVLPGRLHLSPMPCVAGSQRWRGSHTSYARDPSSGPGLPGWSPPDTARPLHTVPPACELRSESAQPLAGPASAAFTHRSTFSIYVQAKGYLWPPPNRKNKQTKSKPLDSNNMKYISIRSFSEWNVDFYQKLLGVWATWV